MNNDLTIQLLALLGTIFISLQVLIGRKWSTKIRSFWAGRISKSTQKGRKLRRQIYQAFYWTCMAVSSANVHY